MFKISVLSSIKFTDFFLYSFEEIPCLLSYPENQCAHFLIHINLPPKVLILLLLYIGISSKKSHKYVKQQKDTVCNRDRQGYCVPSRTQIYIKEKKVLVTSGWVMCGQAALNWRFKFRMFLKKCTYLNMKSMFYTRLRDSKGCCGIHEMYTWNVYHFTLCNLI